MTIDTKQFRDAIGSSRQVTGLRTTLPILACVKLEASDSLLSISTTDLDCYVCEKIECDADLEPVCVNPNKLWYWLASAGEKTKLSCDGKILTLKSGQNVARLNVLPGEEFPALPNGKDAKPIGVTCEDLAAGIKAVAWCAAPPDTEHVLSGVHIASNAKMLLCEASNRRTGAFYEQPLISAQFEALIPSGVVPMLISAMLRKGAEMSLSPNSITIRHDFGFCYAKLIDGNYPNTKTIRETKAEKLGILEVKPVLVFCSTSNVYAPTTSDKIKVHPINLEFSKNGLALLFEGQESNLSTVIDGKFKTATFKHNAVLMAKLLSALEVPEIMVSGGEDSGCMVFNTGNLTIVAMCLRPLTVTTNPPTK